LNHRTILFGEGWTTESAAVRAALRDSGTPVEAPEEAAQPSAVSLALAGMQRLRRGEQAGIGISPIYVQRAEAELKYEQSGGLSPGVRRQAKIARKLGARFAVAGAKRRHRK
jgi:tRNA threonylcarbamoyladenosine biosynthesis protein TsaB